MLNEQNLVVGSAGGKRLSEVGLVSQKDSVKKVSTASTDSNYMEMGVKNAGYDSERSTLSRFQDRPVLPPREILSPYAIDTGMYLVNHSEGKISKETSLTDNTYLDPVDFEKSPEYEDLANYAASIEQARGIGSSNLPRKKQNVIYEPSKPSGLYGSSNYSAKEESLPCCLKLCIVLIALIATLALVMTILLLVGVLKIQKCEDCSSSIAPSTGTGKLGTDSQLTERISNLESNLTSLKKTETKIGDLESVTSQQNATISNLKAQLEKKENNNQNLSDTVEQLKLLVQTLSDTISNINTTLSSRIKNLQQTIDSQAASITELRQIVSSNNTAVLTLLSNETSRRKYEDNVLNDRINSLASEQNGKIGNVSSSVNLVQASYKSDLLRVEGRLNSSISGEVQQLVNGDALLKNDIKLLNSTLLQKILNISLTPGPQGLQGPQGLAGAGNLSGCSYREDETSVTIPSDPKRASANIAVNYIANKVVVGATCSSNKAFVTQFTRNTSLMRCSCKIADSADGDMKCVIHIWECPKTS